MKHTEIVRSRVQSLLTSHMTSVPYILLSESVINQGDTVVRQGTVSVDRPALILPPNIPQFQGFEFPQDTPLSRDAVMNFLLVRGVTLPSMQYDNRTERLDIFEGGLEKAVPHFHSRLQEQENVQTGLVVGPEDCWPFSVLIYVCTQVARNADRDIRHLLNEHKKGNT